MGTQQAPDAAGSPSEAGADEETFDGLFGAAERLKAIGRPPEEVIAMYLRASGAAATRAEALHAASRFCRENDNFADGYEYARRGLEIPAPAGGVSVQSWVYDYGLLDELAVNAYWIGRYEECADACDRLLTEGKLPPEHRERILKNREFALGRLREAAGEASTAPPASAVTTRRRSGWTPDGAAAGTELMVKALRDRLGAKLDRINLQVNHPGHDASDTRPRVVWLHHNVDQTWVQWCKDPALVGMVDRFVFVSYWQRERFLNVFSLPPERCVVLRHALDVSETPRRWEAGPVSRCAYTSTPFRGLSVLLDAWERLSPTNAELNIWSSMKLYGMDDTRYEPVYTRAEAMAGVIYHGIVPNAELRATLQTMHFLTYPCTFEETACLAVIEAMAAGCRVIVPSLGALPETTGGYASVYPSQRDDAAHARVLAHVLAEELANPWGGEQGLSAAQQAYCAAVYDWGHRTLEWERFIDALSPANPPNIVQTAEADRVASAGTPRVFAMVATRNSKFYTEKALASFFEETDLRPQDRFLLFENDPDAANFDKSPTIELVHNPVPRSFAQNANYAIDACLAVQSDLIFLNNDVIFTKGWLKPLLDIEDAISIPFCNQNLQYQVEGLKLSYSMDWDEFGGRIDLLEEIARQNSERFKVDDRGAELLMPFFCFRAPLKILADVGRFDETFGQAGGEDIDYRLRALLVGYDVVHAKRSFLLHFMGKSTWRSGEAAAETQARDSRYRAVFRRKWGPRAAALFLAGGESSETARDSRIAEPLSRHDYRKVLEILSLDEPVSPNMVQG